MGVPGNGQDRGDSAGLVRNGDSGPARNEHSMCTPYGLNRESAHGSEEYLAWRLRMGLDPHIVSRTLADADAQLYHSSLADELEELNAIVDTSLVPRLIDGLTQHTAATGTMDLQIGVAGDLRIDKRHRLVVEGMVQSIQRVPL